MKLPVEITGDYQNVQMTMSFFSSKQLTCQVKFAFMCFLKNGGWKTLCRAMVFGDYDDYRYVEADKNP